MPNFVTISFSQQDISNRQRETLDISLADLEVVRKPITFLLNSSLRSGLGPHLYETFLKSHVFIPVLFRRRQTPTLSSRIFNLIPGDTYPSLLRPLRLDAPRRPRYGRRGLFLTFSCDRFVIILPPITFQGSYNTRHLPDWLCLCRLFSESKPWGNEDEPGEGTRQLPDIFQAEDLLGCGISSLLPNMSQGRLKYSRRRYRPSCDV